MMGKRLAAVDLGSNSFRLEIGRVEHGVFQRTEYLKETVRQGGGLDENRNLTPAAMQAGWDCLARFGERLAGFAPHEVRAVATQTLREARNREDFLQRGNAILGFPINVISGREEARLIYQGVAHMLPPSHDKRLVVDIGGRSTELILGQGMKPLVMESFQVGSIAWSVRYFSHGQFNKKAFSIAEIAAQAVLEEALEAYAPEQWSIAYGSAGTVGAISDVLIANGFPLGFIDRAGLDWLYEKLLAAQSVDKLKIAGMREDRKAIIGGGLSIVRALFDLLKIDTLHQASGGLRHGLICDVMGMVGGVQHVGDDLRGKTVTRLAEKFGVDTAHSERIARVASTLWKLWGRERGSALREVLWAAQLHEIGMRISHSDYHKHGAYILDHADAMGFSLSEMHRLSLLVLGHKGKLRKVGAELPDADPQLMAQLMVLRLAVIFCHARREPDIEGLSIQRPNPQTLQLRWRTGWDHAFPQSAHLLREEVAAWKKTPLMLDVD